MIDLPFPSIARVDVGVALKELPHPLQLGSSRIEQREYAAVRIVGEDGAIGKAYCLTRDAPVELIIRRMLVPVLLASKAATIAEVSDELLRATALVGRVGLVRRAIGLIEIALWDLAAQHAGKPVWDLVESGSAPRQSIIVACYPTPGRTIRELVSEVLTEAEDGWPLIKISRSPDVMLMRELLCALERELPSSTGLIVDVGFGWRTSDEALIEVENWGSPSLAWIEDPFLPEEVEVCARFRRETTHRVGAGDEVTDPRLLVQLAEAGALDLVRTDVVALGGIAATMEAVDKATAAGLDVSTHVYPEVSVHVGTMVETFARSGSGANRYDPAPSLVRGGPVFAGGYAAPPTEPGLGFDLDWGAFEFGR